MLKSINMKALIIDNERTYAVAMAEILTAAGFQAAILDSYDDALDHILNKEAAMVFAPAFCGGSDIGVLVSKIRSFEDPGAARIPVICVSAIPMKDFFDTACEIDLFGYIEKPVSAPEVIIVARKAAFFYNCA
jgi:DNA-binding NtrC family response regulator